MKPKRLKPNPIIPPDLYVERAADRQVRRIVDEMGRPGYVLVARQMGKTNLLLNAKRELQGDNDCFVYLDVSNIFPDFASFLRNIIDTAIDTRSDIFGNIADSIQKRRANSGLAHKEHELELRELLRQLGGKLIICLDEIDALTKTDYSDQVFSFLRSVYFSGRINFSEFNRLTYVLSGVAEPSALIKNRDVSPFNIGEKILLDDFSPQEFDNFVEKAQLGLDCDVRSRIYHWVKGNPRMSWDICSKIEDQLREGINITEATVDEIVKGLYLINFDVPPIDHLRTIAEDDKDIRQALMSLHYGKSSAFSDAIKSRLYLHGFIELAHNNEPIRIKNLVIEEALSESWLQDVEQRKTSILERATKLRTDRRFSEALNLYYDYLKTATAEPDSAITYAIGHCCLETGNYEEAIKQFHNKPYDRNEFPSRYLATQYYLGLCYRYLGKLSEANDRLETVINEGETAKVRTYHYDACIALASVALALGNNYRVVEVTNQILRDEEGVRAVTNDKHADEVMYAAHVNLSFALNRMGDNVGAKACLNKALDFADPLSKVGVWIELERLEEDASKKAAHLVACATHIEKARLAINEPKDDRPLELNTDKFEYVLRKLCGLSESASVERLISFVYRDSVKHCSSAHELVFGLILSAISGSDFSAAMLLMEYALKFDPSGKMSPERRNLLTLALLFLPGEKAEQLEKVFIREFWDRDDAYIAETDFRVAYDIVKRRLGKDDIEGAKAIAERLSILSSKANSYRSDSCDFVMEYISVLWQNKAWVKEKSLPCAQILANRILHNRDLSPPIYFPPSFFSDVRSLLLEWIDLKCQVTQVRNTSKYGRNDRVSVRFQNGTVVKDKYKRLESKILSGECELVEISR